MNLKFTGIIGNAFIPPTGTEKLDVMVRLPLSLILLANLSVNAYDSEINICTILLTNLKH